MWTLGRHVSQKAFRSHVIREFVILSDDVIKYVHIQTLKEILDRWCSVRTPSLYFLGTFHNLCGNNLCGKCHEASRPYFLC